MTRRVSSSLRTDWFRILCDLQHAGLSNSEVSAKLKIPQSTIVGWKAGSEPSFFDGLRLLNLWAATTERNLSDRPQGVI